MRNLTFFTIQSQLKGPELPKWAMSAPLSFFIINARTRTRRFESIKRTWIGEGVLRWALYLIFCFKPQSNLDIDVVCIAFTAETTKVASCPEDKTLDERGMIP